MYCIACVPCFPPRRHDHTHTHRADAATAQAVGANGMSIISSQGTLGCYTGWNGTFPRYNYLYAPCQGPDGFWSDRSDEDWQAPSSPSSVKAVSGATTPALDKYVVRFILDVDVLVPIGTRVICGIGVWYMYMVCVLSGVYVLLVVCVLCDAHVTHFVCC